MGNCWNQFPVLQTLRRLFGLTHLNLAFAFFINQSRTITTAQMGDKMTHIKEIVSVLNKKKRQAINENAQINLVTLMENKWWQRILLSLSSSPCFCSSVLLSLWEAKCAQTEVGQPENQCKSADQRGENRTGPLTLRPRLHGGSSWWAPQSLCKSFLRDCDSRVALIESGSGLYLCEIKPLNSGV